MAAVEAKDMDRRARSVPENTEYQPQGASLVAAGTWGEGTKMLVVPLSGSMKAGSGFDPNKWKACNPGPISSSFTHRTVRNADVMEVKIVQEIEDLAGAVLTTDFDPIGPAKLLPEALLDALAKNTTVMALVHMKSTESQFNMMNLHTAELSHSAARRSFDAEPQDKMEKLKEEFGSHVVVATETGWALTRVCIFDCPNVETRRYVAAKLYSQCGEWGLDSKGRAALKDSLTDLEKYCDVSIKEFASSGSTLVDCPQGGKQAKALLDTTNLSHEPFRAFVVPIESFGVSKPKKSLSLEPNQCSSNDKRMWEEYLKETTRLLFAKSEAKRMPESGESAELKKFCDQALEDFRWGRITTVTNDTICAMQRAIEKIYSQINSMDKAFKDWLDTPTISNLMDEPLFSKASAAQLRAMYQGKYLRTPEDETATQIGSAEIRDLGFVHGATVRSVPVFFEESFADERNLYVEVVLSGIDADHNASTRIKVYAEDISSKGFLLTAETFEESAVNSVTIAWMATTSPRIFTGQVKTDEPTLQWTPPNFKGPSLFPLPVDGASVRRVFIPVSFPRRLDRAPAVWTGIHKLNMDRQRMRLRTAATNVTEHGFTMVVETRDDSCIWEVGVSWVATLDPDLTVGEEVVLGSYEDPITTDQVRVAPVSVPGGLDSGDVVTAVTSLNGLHAPGAEFNARIWTIAEMLKDSRWAIKTRTTLDSSILHVSVGTLFKTSRPNKPKKSATTSTSSVAVLQRQGSSWLESLSSSLPDMPRVPSISLPSPPTMPTIKVPSVTAQAKGSSAPAPAQSKPPGPPQPKPANPGARPASTGPRPGNGAPGPRPAGPPQPPQPRPQGAPAPSAPQK